jgi:hypothetical protein
MREVAHLPISPYISLYLRTSPYVSQVEYMKEVAKNAAEDLSLEERNLLSVAYKNVVGARRGSSTLTPTVTLALALTRTLALASTLTLTLTLTSLAPHHRLHREQRGAEG